MVIYFTSTVCDPPATIYMGRDKFENEEMLQHGVEEDIWFHVDSLSSAHVYLKLQPSWTFETIPQNVLTDCVQLVKHNSIEGNKKNDVKINYTPFTNLKKEPHHEAGEVVFHSKKLTKSIIVEKRINEIINRLNKTKTDDKQFDWAADKARRLKEEKQKKKMQFELNRQQQEAEEKEREALKQARSYDNVFKEEKMTSNKFDGPVDVKKYEEDFF